jgi:hypothetical protein
MRSTLITLVLAVAAATATTASAAKSDYPVAKRATSLPPSADLSYTVKGSARAMAAIP